MQRNEDNAKNKKYVQQFFLYSSDDDLKIDISKRLDWAKIKFDPVRGKISREAFQVLFEDCKFTSDKIKRYQDLFRSNPSAKEQIEFIIQRQLDLRGLKYMAVSSRKSKPPYEGFLKFWELFPFFLPPKARREAYEPAYNDLKSDFLKASRLNNSKLAKRWLKFCFVCQTLYMIVNCIWAWMGSKLRKIVWHSIAESFRKMSGG